ncbi:LRV domain-containing protein [Actinomadura logoneensis]|uniref:LRV domain-containing protein n=1 Tax=Actinomadura logoneensis TaxID=2293572 RepID=A0A372JJJ0_9ACTN|nr:LRV domain-containing protein [Actinomadura logoneensis]RFU40187.1 LRV domain-containing protein [Actinomadura logoneensis]
MDKLNQAQLIGLAQNPNAPTSTLLALLGTGDHEIQRRVLSTPHVPAQVWDAAVTHPDEHVRRMVANNRYAPPEQRARLVTDPAADVRIATAQGPSALRETVPPLPEHAYAVLAEDADRRVREALAGRHDIPPSTRRTLCADQDPGVRAAAVHAWPDPPDDITDRLLADPVPSVRRTAALKVVARRPELVPALLADDELDDYDKATKVAKTARLDRETALRLARHEDPDFREAVAANPHTPADLVAELARDPEHEVRLAVSMRPELTEEQRAAIDYHVAPKDFVRPPGWAWERLDDLQTMRRCATSAHPALRRAAAYSPYLPPDLVDLLAEDDDFSVRLLLTEHHPSPPPALLLSTLLENPFISRFDELSRPEFPRENLRRFATSDDPGARALAAHDPDAPPDLIERLSHDPDPGVRRVMASDPRLPRPRLLALLADRETATAAAANPALPREVMTALMT